MPPSPVEPRSLYWLLPGTLLAICMTALLVSWWAGILTHSPDPLPLQDNNIPVCHLSTRECQQAGARIRLSTDTLRPMQSAVIRVDWPLLVSDQPLELRLEGKEMPMGTYKLLLKKQPPGHYQAELMLPVCTSNTMTWIGTLTSTPAEHQPPLYISLRMASQ